MMKNHGRAVLLMFVTALGVSLCASQVGWAQEGRSNGSVAPPPPEADLFPKGAPPFAEYEAALKKSERWQNLSPEEQDEALRKIADFRKRFMQRQAELQKQYTPFLEKKKKKAARWKPPEEDASHLSMQDIWEKWQALPPSRRYALARRWNLSTTRPDRQRRAVFEVWEGLMPTERLQFLRDMES